MSPSLLTVGLVPCLLSALVAASPVPNPQTESIVVVEGDVIIENPTVGTLNNYGQHDPITVKTTIYVTGTADPTFSILPFPPLSETSSSHVSINTGGPLPPVPTGPPKGSAGPAIPLYPNSTSNVAPSFAPSSGFLTGTSAGTAYSSSFGTSYSAGTAYSSGIVGTAGTAGTSGFPVSSIAASPLWPNATTIAGPITISPSGILSTGTAPGTAPLSTHRPTPSGTSPPPYGPPKPSSDPAPPSYGPPMPSGDPAPSSHGPPSPSHRGGYSTITDPTPVLPSYKPSHTPTITPAPTTTPAVPTGSAANGLSDLIEYIQSLLESFFPGYKHPSTSTGKGGPTSKGHGHGSDDKPTGHP